MRRLGIAVVVWFAAQFMNMIVERVPIAAFVMLAVVAVASCRDFLGLGGKVYREPDDGGSGEDAVSDVNLDTVEADVVSDDTSDVATVPCSTHIETDNENCGRCGRSCSAGESCSGGQCPIHVLASNIGLFTYGLAQDANYIYWTADTYPYALRLVSKTGGPTYKVFESSDTATQYHPAGLAVDATHIYWTALFVGGIYQGTLNGTAAITDVKTLGQTFRPAAIALNQTSVFVVDFAGAPAGRISRLTKDVVGSIVNIVPDQQEPIGIAADDQFVFWTVSSGADRGLWRVEANGNGKINLAETNVQSKPVAVDANWVYWQDYGKREIRRFSKYGDQDVWMVHEELRVSGFGVDADRLYYFAYDADTLAEGGATAFGELKSIKKDGTDLHVLAKNEVFGYDSLVVVDDTFAYWIANQQIRKTVK